MAAATPLFFACDTMTRARRFPLVRPASALAVSLLLAGCGTDLQLPPANLPIAQQQIQLYALTGTPVYTPSAYDMLTLGEVRLDKSNAFDFAVDIRFDSAYGIGKHNDTVVVLIPRGALGFAHDPGLIFVPSFNFDSITVAPSTGYTKDRAVSVHEGDVLIAASRITTCNFGFTLPHYAKLQIQQIDLTNLKVTIGVVIDPNCGYRQFGSGIPDF